MKRLKILQAVLDFTQKLHIQGLKFFTNVLHSFFIVKLSAIKNQKYKMNNVLVDKSLHIIPVSETSSYSPISSGSPTSVCNSSGDFLIANSYQQSSIFKGNLISESFSFWSLRQKICKNNYA